MISDDDPPTDRRMHACPCLMPHACPMFIHVEERRKKGLITLTLILTHVTSAGGGGGWDGHATCPCTTRLLACLLMNHCRQQHRTGLQYLAIQRASLRKCHRQAPNPRNSVHIQPRITVVSAIIISMPGKKQLLSLAAHAPKCALCNQQQPTRLTD